MIPVVFCVDAAGLKYINAPIQSILNNTKEKIDFWILLDRNITELPQGKKYKYQKVDIPEIKTFCRTIVKSKAMFYRWLIPDILIGYDKAIYLDFDVILNTDIKHLYNIDIGDNAIGAVRDCYNNTIRKTARNDFQGNVSERDMFMIYNCDMDRPSFCSGQLVMNLKKWRQKNITNQLIDFVVKYKTADMLPLNVILQDDIYELNYKWCAPAHTLKENLTPITPSLGNKDYSDAFLFHYNGTAKPWMANYPNKKLKSLWSKYANKI